MKRDSDAGISRLEYVSEDGRRLARIVTLQRGCYRIEPMGIPNEKGTQMTVLQSTKRAARATARRTAKSVLRILSEAR